MQKQMVYVVDFASFSEFKNNLLTSSVLVYLK